MESELATPKNNNADLLKTNTKANLTIAAICNQIEKFGTSVLPEKCHFSEKLPDLKLYDSAKQKLQSWIYNLRVKLAGNADYYSTKSSKIQYSIGHLTGKTLDQVKLRVKKDDTIKLVISSDLITYLEIAFGNLNKKKIFWYKLHKLKQANYAFLDYLADFFQIANCIEYNKKAKHAVLLTGLFQEM